MNKADKLKTISYIGTPKDLQFTFGDFKVDPSIKLPVQRKEGEKHLREEDITIESIVAGMLTIIAYEEKHPDFSYYRDFVNAVNPTTAEELNKAAIAKEQQKDYEFAEELFLAVYHMLPQPASCVNLATLYSYISVHEEEKGNEDASDEALMNAHNTLLDGLERFGENEMILSELASFEGYMGNLEEAKEYVERYLAVAVEGERKVEMKEFLKKLELQLNADNSFKEAYDFIMLNMPQKAIAAADRFIISNPKMWNGYFIKAWALRKMEKYQEAKENLLKCIELGESNTDIYNELSICELESGNRALAKDYLSIAIDLDAYNLKAISNLAFLHLQDEEFDEARYFLEKARALSEKDEIITHLIGEYEKATGEKIGDIITEEVMDEEDNEDKSLIEDEYLEGSSISEHEVGHQHHCCSHHHHSEDHVCTCGGHHGDGTCSGHGECDCDK